LGRISSFVEKPTLAEIREHYGVADDLELEKLNLLTNAGFYLVEASALRQIADHPQIATLRRTRLDFGKDLLPWLVGHGYPVYASPVRRIGDLGNVEEYLASMVDVLHGDFESVVRHMGPPFDPEAHVWNAPESLQMRDSETQKTLAEKLQEGLVTIGPAVRIGRYCEIGPGVLITESNLDDGGGVRAGAFIRRPQTRDGEIVGRRATIRNSVIGSMSEVRSDPANPTVLED